MNDYFSYTTSSPEDKQWGLYLTVSGRHTAAPGSVYPQKAHPSGYFFEWESGRVLSEYQLIFISDGFGHYETAHGSYDVKPGTLLLVEPDIRHRYRPDPATGWTEYYVGFNGHLAAHFIASTFGQHHASVHYSENQMEFIDTYQKIHDLVAEQKPAYHQIASGLILKLLGYVAAQEKARLIDNIHVEQLVSRAKDYMWKHVHSEVDFQAFSREQSVSYSYFRKAFKLYTGIAPHQFYLDLKIMRAKELIIATDKSIKEITFELGFDSIHYFSRIFKKKTGQAPSNFR
ncbi:helix-turn-helix transcriptional regulator [Marinoscillum furvescens]|uniref:AraC family transcriptional regulator n=1 Tax=Marinoscillum furvescens DSM 4134 TaxID=1122208 RepID=A0A3D9LFX0_MARFU|nr:AraC family transcriptional regulator [Marinoscillum furvescens]REE05528.1 AraC family transcriptional regulator [Marinoscillum furvescens DSM 4134]